MESKKINRDALLDIGFKPQYENHRDGFYILDVGEKLYFTVDFETMNLSIQLRGYGHVQKLEHIKNIEQLSDLFFYLTGNSIKRDEFHVGC